jgi:hypothetical protein
MREVYPDNSCTDSPSIGGTIPQLGVAGLEVVVEGHVWNVLPSCIVRFYARAFICNSAGEVSSEEFGQDVQGRLGKSVHLLEQPYLMALIVDLVISKIVRTFSWSTSQ